MSNHRAGKASVQSPCPAQRGASPHLQIIPNQEFNLEWSQGHSNNGQSVNTVWWVVVKMEDMDWIGDENLLNYLQDYVDSAPTDEAKQIDPKWERTHVQGRYIKATGDAMLDPYETAFEPGWVDRAAPHYKDRSGFEYLRWTKNNEYAWPDLGDIPWDVSPGTAGQRRYKSRFRKDDQRAKYHSEKYPWIETAMKFEINMGVMDNSFFPNQGNIMRAEIDARQGPGHYIAYYQWAGYKDCVDIEIRDQVTPTTAPYGNSSKLRPQEWVKIDHCSIAFQLDWAVAPRRFKAGEDLSTCINRATDLGAPYVVATRVNNFQGTYAGAPNIPFVRGPVATVVPYCGDWSAPDRESKGCTVEDTLIGPTHITDDWLFTEDEDDYICYAPAYVRSQDFGVAEDYTIHTDPADPGWYSTCFVASADFGMLDVPHAIETYVPPSWSVGGTCLDCDWYQEMLKMPYYSFPDWTKSFSKDGRCYDCSLKNLTMDADAYLRLLATSQVNIPKAGAAGDAANAGWVQDDASSQQKKNSVVMIGILIGVGLAVILIIVGVVFYCRKKNRTSSVVATQSRMTQANAAMTVTRAPILAVNDSDLTTSPLHSGSGAVHIPEKNITTGGAFSEWSELHTDDGTPYYFNAKTNVTQWEKPI